MKNKNNNKPQNLVYTTDISGALEAAQAIAQLFGVTLDDLRSMRKQAELITPRFAVVFVLYKDRGLSSDLVARVLKRKRSSIHYAAMQFQNWLDTSEMTLEVLTNCREAAKKALGKFTASHQQVTGKFTASDEQVTSKCLATNQQVTNKSARNNPSKKPKTTRKKKKQGELLESYQHNRKEPPYYYIYNKNNRVEYILPERLDNPDFFRTWNEWLDHRRDIKKPLNQNMVKAQLKMMNREGAAVAIETMEQSMAQGWVGLFPEKITGRKNSARHTTNNSEYNNKTKANYSGAAKQRATEDVGEVF